MNCLKLLSPAKINLSLHVKKKRPDGYHELQMVMTEISLYDEISIELKDRGISLSSDNRHIPTGKSNIAWKAAETLIERKGLHTGVHIDIKKNIPIGGGLGGGSSNAASVLMGLNELTGNRASREELMSMGLSLGADVPFFVFSEPAFAEGIGEKLTPLKNLPEIHFILINPGIHVNTSEIFSKLNLGLTKKGEELNITGFSSSLSDICAGLHNDLEKVTFGIYPEVKKAKEMLLEKGAIGALMSGSGSTIFGICENEKNAKKIYYAMEDDILSRGWHHYLVKSI